MVSGGAKSADICCPFRALWFECVKRDWIGLCFSLRRLPSSLLSLQAHPVCSFVWAYKNDQNHSIMELAEKVIQEKTQIYRILMNMCTHHICWRKNGRPNVVWNSNRLFFFWTNLILYTSVNLFWFLSWMIFSASSKILTQIIFVAPVWDLKRANWSLKRLGGSLLCFSQPYSFYVFVWTLARPKS